jgi:hypothetical protein
MPTLTAPEAMPMFHTSPLVDHDWCMVAQPDDPSAPPIPLTLSSRCSTVHHRNGCQGASGPSAWHPRLVTVFDEASHRCEAPACRSAR